MDKIQSSSSLVKAFQQGSQQVSVAGWVRSRRDHGGLIFVDLRDYTGLVQLVFSAEDSKLFQQANRLRNEWVIYVEGQLRLRQEDTLNPKLATGHLEIAVNLLKILNSAQTPPIPVNDEDPKASEDKRLLYRYLDLRRPQMQANLKLRADFYKFIRRFMEAANFTEVPTPILANSSPEGARDFLIPSRLHLDRFYALPQAPQQFKQLLMVGGVERYYQIAACFRDEDPRSDRLYGDFYQLDLEMAFVEDSQVVRETVWPLVTSLITEFAGLKLNKPICPVMTYKEALDKYGTDKPDLRFGLELVDVGEVFADTKVEILQKVQRQQGLIKALSVNNILSSQQIKRLTDQAKDQGASGLTVLSFEAGNWRGPLVKFLSSRELTALANQLAIADQATVLMVADSSPALVNKVLGGLRDSLGTLLGLKNDDIVAAIWIVDFPFFEQDEVTQQLTFGHNPFSKPKGDLEQADKLAIVADQFDLVLNGYEVCSGAARNHDANQLFQAFTILGYDQQVVQEQFGALLKAFQYGAPPHAGCAFGLDRLLMILARESNIRELVAFPKNGSGLDLMMSSPTTINKQQRKELGL